MKTTYFDRIFRFVNSYQINYNNKTKNLALTWLTKINFEKNAKPTDQKQS